MKSLLTILITLITFSANAQPDIHSPMDSLLTKFGQKKVNTGLPGLMDLDLKIIYSMPTISEYKKISTRIKELSDDYVRMLDSVDYFRSGKDTLIVTIYSQNYAYHSGNSYKLQINSNNDSLKLYYIFYDMVIKKDIEDYFDFIGRKFEYKVLDKEIGDMKKTKRTIIIKKILLTYTNSSFPLLCRSRL